MTKKRLQKKVKSQEQEIYRLKTIILNASRVFVKLADKEGIYTDEVTRYAFLKASYKLIERLYKKSGV